MGSDWDSGTGVGPGLARVRRRRRRRALGPLALPVFILCLAALVFIVHSASYSHLLSPFFGPGPNSGQGGSAGSGDSGSGHVPGQGPNQGPDQRPDPGSSQGSDPETGQGTARELTQEELASIRPNELGKVMVIMYHDIQEKEGEWVRSRANFGNDLQRFNDLGYSLIPFNSYLTGDIDVPAGRVPLILTFDDATPGQLKTTDQDGQIVPDPDSAVGMLLAFSEKHPEFGHAATFFVDFPAPFGDSARVRENLRFLVENGMEIGNHTYNHRNLGSASPALVAEEIGRLANKVKELSGYEVKSLALPYGGYPGSKDNLGSGEWDGQKYVNLGVLLVGAEAAPSPFSAKFKPMAIPRIRGSQDELDKWLGYFQKYPERRFVSDGQAGTVTIPGVPGSESKADLNPDLDLDRVGSRKVVTYLLPADRAK